MSNREHRIPGCDLSHQDAAHAPRLRTSPSSHVTHTAWRDAGSATMIGIEIEAFVISRSGISDGTDQTPVASPWYSMLNEVFDPPRWCIEKERFPEASGPDPTDRIDPRTSPNSVQIEDDVRTLDQAQLKFRGHRRVATSDHPICISSEPDGGIRPIRVGNQPWIVAFCETEVPFRHRIR